MAPLSSAASPQPVSRSLPAPWASPIAFGFLIHVFVWTVGPWLIAGNLHADTLEAAYWGREWALGYPKHPPLVSLTLDLTLGLGAPPILSLMVLSQATVAIAALYLWRTIRLFASAETAAFGGLMYLTSPIASFYAMQINHNSMLSPFVAAAAFYGVRYLQQGHTRDALLLAFAAAAGFWTKYEIVFPLVALVGLAAMAPGFRWAFRRPISYVAVALFLGLLVPHVLWLNANDWPTLAYVRDSKLDSWPRLAQSGEKLASGLFALYAAPALMLFATRRRRGSDGPATGLERLWTGRALAFGPPLALVLGAALSGEVIKSLWMQPFCVTAAIGIALLRPIGGLSQRDCARLLVVVSPIIFAGLFLYLVVAGAIGRPLEAFSPDTKPLAAATQALWDEQGRGPLRCVFSNDARFTPSGVLWLKSRPVYVDLSGTIWSQQAQIAACLKTGAVAVLMAPTADAALARLPTACIGPRRRVEVGMMPLQGAIRIPIDLVFIAPAAEDGACQENVKAAP